MSGDRGLLLILWHFFIHKKMADLNLDIFILQTYNVKTLAVVDASTYTSVPPAVVSPSLAITPPGFNTVVLPFKVNVYNIFNSASLGISPVGTEEPLPDGVYYLKYTVAPALENFVDKTWMRVDKIQEKFDAAFMSLDMMECDSAIKSQEKVTLSSIYFLIQGSIAAANNCAITVSQQLYAQADKMLDQFINGGCGCSGTFRTY